MSDDPIEDLVDAVIANDAHQVQAILSQGIDPNSCLDEDLVTPLHFAAMYNALLVIPLLIYAGAEIDAETKPDSYTPMDIALLHENYQVVQLLLAYQKGESRA